MAITTLVRIVITGSLTRPIGVLALLGLFSCWPAVVVLAPLGITSSGMRNDAWTKEFAFLGSSVGCVLGVASLERLQPLLRGRSPGLRLHSGMLAVATTGLAGAAAALAPVLVLSSGDVVQTARSLAPVGLAHLATLSAGGVLAVSLHLPGGMAPWLLGASTALMPLLLPDGAALRTLAPIGAAALLSAWLLDHRPWLAP